MTPFSSFPVFHWAATQAAQTAVVWHNEENAPSPFPTQLSWQQVAQLIANFSQKLPACSQIIAYSGTHKLFGLLCYCAVIAANKQILGLNPHLTETQRTRILADNRVDLLITDQDLAQYLAEPSAYSTNFFFEPHQPATLTLTSGSSGKPKAVVHSVQNHLENAAGVCQLMQFTAQHSWLLGLPLFHVSGQGIVWRWLLQGATLVIDQSKTRVWQTLASVSHASLVPTQLQRYLQNLPANRPLAQHILLGGAHIPAKLIEQAQQQNITTYAGYGMTEMASTICAGKNQLDNVGEPLQGREVYIAQGEIWVRGAGLAQGYWLDGNIQPLANAEGWFATQDKGEWRDNQLVVCGRLDNMFISGGENIQPEEIEQALYRSQQLKNVFVVPKKDHEFGERPVALVEFHEDFTLQAVENLQKFANAQLERFKQPVAYLPLISEQWQQNGIKISRQHLKEYVQNLFCENCNEID